MVLNLFIYIFIRGASGDAVATRLNNDIGGLGAYCERSPLDKEGNIIENEDSATGY